MHGRLQKIILLILVISGWFALIAQFYIIIENRAASIAETVVRYFSFFTIFTNLIVAVCCSVILLSSASNGSKFFRRSTTLTAVAVYITVVGIVYNTILRFLWNPQGLQLIVDELLHSIIPVLFIVLWFLSTSAPELKWKNIFPWLLYPVAYIIYVLIRGSFSGFYPYPFIDVSSLGYAKVLANCIGLLFFFLFLSASFAAVGRWKQKFNR